MKRYNCCFRCGERKNRTKMRAIWIDEGGVKFERGSKTKIGKVDSIVMKEKIVFQCFECEESFKESIPW